MFSGLHRKVGIVFTLSKTIISDFRTQSALTHTAVVTSPWRPWRGSSRAPGRQSAGRGSCPAGSPGPPGPGGGRGEWGFGYLGQVWWGRQTREGCSSVMRPLDTTSAKTVCILERGSMRARWREDDSLMEGGWDLYGGNIRAIREDMRPRLGKARARQGPGRIKAGQWSRRDWWGEDESWT